MNLYEINEQILQCCDSETGEIIDEEKLAELNLAFDEKVENIALWIKNLLADAEAIKMEKLKLAERQKAAENKAESLKKYLTAFMCGGKFKTARVQIGWRKSKQVQVQDIQKIDDDYLKYAEPTVDKTKIKKAIEAGVEIEGAELVEINNIQIR